MCDPDKLGLETAPRRSRVRQRLAIAAALFALAPAGAAAGPLEDLAPGTWYEVPNSHLRDVAHDWSPGSTPGNVSGVIAAWCGGAFDTKRERLLVTGGGHGDYGGNEVYALALDTVDGAPGTNPWEKLSEPEVYGALDADCSNADNLTDNGQRRAQHTYSRLAYVPELDALCDTGGSIGYTYCPALRQLDCFDLGARTWALALTPASSAGTGSVGAVHPVTGEWWLQGGSGSGLLGRFDPRALTWAYGHYDNIPGSSPGDMSAAIDPTRNLFVAIGSQRLWALDLATFEEGVTELSEHPVVSTGGGAVVDAAAPGFAYDPVQDRMVAWSGGADVYLLDLDTWAFTRTTPGGATPTAAVPNGTFGRFRYSPRYGVFIVVNSVDQNAFVVKLSASSADAGADASGEDASGEDASGEDASGEDASGEDASGDAGGKDASSEAASEAGATPNAPAASSESGCGCRAAGGGAGSQIPSWWGVTLGVLALAWRRRGARWPLEAARRA